VAVRFVVVTFHFASRFAAAALVALVLPSRIKADSVTLEPSKDNTLYEDRTGMLSNGAGTEFFVGSTSQDLIRRGLLAFDVAAQIPPGATVHMVQLKLSMDRTMSGPQTVKLHRVLADWGEGTSHAAGNEGMGAEAQPGDATWLHRFFDDKFWLQPGGDFEPTPSAMQLVGAEGTYSWSSPAMVADLQEWVDSPASNFGWILIGNESASRTTKSFNTKESSSAVRPKLTIDFSPPGASPTASFSPTASPTATPSAPPSETPLSTASPSASALPSPTPSPTVSVTPAATQSPTPSMTAPACVGDCDRNGQVSLPELVTSVRITIGQLGIERCPDLDRDDDRLATIDELVEAVSNALGECPSKRP